MPRLCHWGLTLVVCANRANGDTRSRIARHEESWPRTVTHMLRIGSIVLHVSDTQRSAAFWGRALGYQSTHNPDFLEPADGGGTHLHLDSTDRTHLDLWVDSEIEQSAEVERLLSLGATRVDWEYPHDADFIVLADPDGVLFCVVNTGR